MTEGFGNQGPEGNTRRQNFDAAEDFIVTPHPMQLPGRQTPVRLTHESLVALNNTQFVVSNCHVLSKNTETSHSPQT